MALKPPPKKSSNDKSFPLAPLAGSPSSQTGQVAKNVGAAAPASPLAQPKAPPLKAQALPSRVTGAAAPSQPTVPKTQSPQIKGAPQSGAVGLALSATDEVIKSRIEDLVFAVPELSDTALMGFFPEFMRKILTVTKVPETSSGILAAFSDISANAEQVSQVIRKNQYFESQFMKGVRAIAKSKDVERFEAALVMYGMQNSRNMILTMQAFRSVFHTHVPWSKDGVPAFSVNEKLKYALSSEEGFIFKKEGYAELAFAAGMIYDLLVLLVDGLELQERRKLLKFIDLCYLNAIRTAKLALTIVTIIPTTKYRKYIYSTCLLQEVGQAVMALLNPNYIAFAEECEKKPTMGAFPIRRFFEERLFGPDHATLSGLVSEHLALFKPISRVVSRSREPYLIKNEDQGFFELASLVCLATNIRRNFKRITKATDPVAKTWLGPELRGFNIDMDRVVTLVNPIKLPS